jgi:glutathione S-transferase
MKFYNSVGPNPRVVRMFMAERGVEVPRVEVDLRGGENRQAPYMAKNPAGQMPCLELDDGTVLAEITAICEYLDETAPPGRPSLIGDTPLARAECRMWTRRVDLNIVEPLANGYRFAEGLRFFESRFRCIPEAAEGLKQTAQDKLRWLDGLIAGRAFLCGDRLTLADILLFAFLDFGSKVGQPIDPSLGNVAAHHARMAARPSAKA